MAKQRRAKRLWDCYKFPGFKPTSTVTGVFGDRQTRVITLTRRSKKQSAETAEKFMSHGMIVVDEGYVIFRAAEFASTLNSTIAA
jgi:hypothetical protein